MSWMGCLKGIAYGDSWGRQNEFLSYEDIPEWGTVIPPEHFFITDDTQMTLYLADALEHPGIPIQKRISKVKEKFIEWLHDPDNNRFPGDTCLESIRNLELQRPVENDSKGNGSLMRVFPCAYVNKSRHQIAKMQSELTHKHPSAADSCVIAIYVVTNAQRKVITSQNALDEAFYVSEKYPEIRSALAKAIDYRDNPDIQLSYDECSWIGEGWIAEEALALALYFLGLDGSATYRLGKAATCGGDSDTIAAITGGFIGALEGDVWPEDWINRLEPRYKAWITKEWDIK